MASVQEVRASERVMKVGAARRHTLISQQSAGVTGRLLPRRRRTPGKGWPRSKAQPHAEVVSWKPLFPRNWFLLSTCCWPGSRDKGRGCSVGVIVQHSDPRGLLCQGGLLRAELNSEHNSSSYPRGELITFWSRGSSRSASSRQPFLIRPLP